MRVRTRGKHETLRQTLPITESVMVRHRQPISDVHSRLLKMFIARKRRRKETRGRVRPRSVILLPLALPRRVRASLISSAPNKRTLQVILVRGDSLAPCYVTNAYQQSCLAVPSAQNRYGFNAVVMVLVLMLSFTHFRRSMLTRVLIHPSLQMQLPLYLPPAMVQPSMLTLPSPHTAHSCLQMPGLVAERW
jgi:hypothetical protein